MACLDGLLARADPGWEPVITDDDTGPVAGHRLEPVLVAQTIV
jgi:hypothetical protein